MPDDSKTRNVYIAEILDIRDAKLILERPWLHYGQPMAHCRKGDESEYRAVAVGCLSRWCFEHWACIMRQFAASCTFMQKHTQHMLPKFAAFKADEMVSSGRLLNMC